MKWILCDELQKAKPARLAGICRNIFTKISFLFKADVFVGFVVFQPFKPAYKVLQKVPNEKRKDEQLQDLAVVYAFMLVQFIVVQM